MKKIIVLVCLILQSCGSYTYESYRPTIKSLLAITEAGDTVPVSMSEFERQKYDTYTRFNYNGSWHWNNWRYSNNLRGFEYPNGFWNNYGFNSYNWNNYRPVIRPKVQPKNRPRPRVIPNNPPRRVNPPTRRITPRRATPTRSGNNTRSSNKQ